MQDLVPVMLYCFKCEAQSTVHVVFPVHFVQLSVELFDIKVFKKQHISALLASRLVARVEVHNAQSQVMGIHKNFIFSHCTERYICTCILYAKM